MRTHVTSEGQQEIVELLDQPLNWQYIAQLLNLNRVTSLFAYNTRNFPQVADTPVGRRLANQLSQNAMANLRLKGALQQILELFARNNIRVVTFKGPTLAEIIYGNLALRHILDLDLLVDQQQFKQAGDLLETLGYEVLRDPDDPLYLEQAEKYHTKFVHPETKIKVELHWHLVEIWRSVLDNSVDFWQFVVPMSFDGVQMDVFCKEFLFIYLCVHGYRHYWERLKWLVDIAELVENDPELDWSIINALAQRYGLVEVVDIALLLAQNTLGAHIPDDAAARIAANPKLARLEPTIRQIQFPAEVDFAANTLSPSRRFFFEYSLVESGHKRRLILHQIEKIFLTPGRWKPNQADRDWIHLPDSMRYLYYFLRPVRLLIRYGREQVKLMFSLLFRR